MKNIVLCCDGTANEFSDHNTNVVKLYQLLVKDPARQVTYYHPGVGTMEAVGALTSFARKITKTLGLVIGYGLEDDIRAAYLFLMRTYSPGDRIFMFGFSRGAYTTRAVAALLHMYGLMEGNNEALIPYAIRLQSAMSNGEKANKVFALAQQFKATFSGPPVPIYFTGLWDTVNSVGWKTNPLKLPHTADNPDIDIARHAVSIDERRAFFRQNLWRPKPPSGGPRQLKQVWFPGDHADVGGGRAESETAQSRIALAWMLREAVAAGLLVDETAAATVAASSGSTSTDLPRLHDKLHDKPSWWILEFLPFPHYDYATGKTSWRMNRARRRTIPPGSFIHSSAFARGADYVSLLPPDGVSTD